MKKMKNIPIIIEKELAKRVRNFWFEGFVHDQPIPQSLLMKKWFSSPNKELDDYILNEFGSDMKKYINLHSQQDVRVFDNTSNQDLLSYIILLDQFPRNAYRGTRNAFAGDPMALSCTKYLIDQGRDTELHPIERFFVYLPLEHSENLKDQETCLERMQHMIQLCSKEVPATNINQEKNPYQIYLPFLKMAEKYAVEHYELIKEFNRFPHRNEILGRSPLSVKEEQYLANGGTGAFGVSYSK